MEMKKFLQKKLKNEKGMTLIELLAVIVIIAIIAAIAIPAIGNIINNSRVGAIKSDAQMIISAAELYYTDNPTQPAITTLTPLLDGGYLDNAGSFENSGATFTGVSKPAGATKAAISGKGVVGDVDITFAAATRAHIEGLSNSAADGATSGGTPATVTLNR
ncbi:prepilin-type N-terminal cleavage/methylation domain-containing protein [Planococcus chinensis]|uniref:Prepilin-type N-terminal cleavage/methylation domain-containing protein n=1 Tax=Planococcus chinensis TaxID=272917 RepID=A0ABW4QJW9_9BACL